jgi:hypothetical protein
MVYPNNKGRFHLYVNAALGDSKDKGGLGAALYGMVWFFIQRIT